MSWKGLAICHHHFDLGVLGALGNSAANSNHKNWNDHTLNEQNGTTGFLPNKSCPRAKRISSNLPHCDDPLEARQINHSLRPNGSCRRLWWEQRPKTLRLLSCSSSLITGQRPSKTITLKTFISVLKGGGLRYYQLWVTSACQQPSNPSNRWCDWEHVMGIRSGLKSVNSPWSLRGKTRTGAGECCSYSFQSIKTGGYKQHRNCLINQISPHSEENQKESRSKGFFLELLFCSDVLQESAVEKPLSQQRNKPL